MVNPSGGLESKGTLNQLTAKRFVSSKFRCIRPENLAEHERTVSPLTLTAVLSFELEDGIGHGGRRGCGHVRF